MSTTYTDVLPPTKSSPHRAIRYTPACGGVGTLEVQDKRSSTRYVVQCLPFGGVRLTKADGETYVVTPAACECAAFVLRGLRCRHIDSVESLYANGWLDDRETTGDRYEDADERDEWFDDNSPDRAEDDEYADALGRRIVCEIGGC
jgi:hypothetical protein